MPLSNAMNNGASSAGPSSSRSTHPLTDQGSNNNAHRGRYEHRDDDSDEIDLLGDDSSPIITGDAADNDDDPTAILRDDPLQSDLSSPFTFKRKQKQSGFLSQPGRFIKKLTGRNYFSSSPRTSHDLPQAPTSTTTTTTIPPAHINLNPLPPANTNLDQNASYGKDMASSSYPHNNPHDWYAEGPGRRVGYEDLTAIDWIFEYTKERQRQRALRHHYDGTGAAPLLGYLRRLLDASQVWVVLLLCGPAVGVLAAAIDVAADWLGDVKYGFCSGDVDGGRFYLGRTACCLGYDEGSQCRGWREWGDVLGARNDGARWFAEGAVYLCLAVTFATSAAVLVKEYGVYARHSGIPEIKTVLGGFVIRRFLGLWTLITKSLGLVLAVASGLWLGKEGPLVHVACCCANLFTKLFPSINNNEARKREVLSAAAASGISVAFGSPIGGVLFSLEQLSYYFPDKTMWQSFVCAMTAAMVLQALDPFRSGKLVLYQVTYTSSWHGFEVIPFVLLGILGGIYGGLFIKANMAVARWRKSTPWLPGPVVQVAIVAVLTALINYPNRYMRSQNSELVSDLFSQCSELLDDQFGLCKTGAASAANILLLLLAAVLSFGLAAITFGLQIPAGIILPSMAIGALTGRAIGIIMEMWQANHPKFIAFRSCDPDIPCITPGTYAIIGAAAALAGVTRMTVSIVVIMFELTGALAYVLPIMVAVMISKWVGDAFSRRGIYESWIHFNEYPFLDLSEETTPIPDIPASQIMTRIEDLVVLTATGHTIASLTSILEAHPYRGFPVVSDPRDAILLGYISRAELAYTLHAATRPPRSLPPETEAFFAHQPMADPRSTLDLRPWMDQTPLTLPGACPLQLAVSYFQKLGLRYVLFADRGVLQGLLTKKDVWYVLNGAEETRRTSGMAGGDDDGVGIGVTVAGGSGEGGGSGTRVGLARERGDGESAGLLRAVGLAEETELASPGIDGGSIL
ncbi:chloride channel [Corynascus novoguineensis]|uniref:Chloride channel protein n=1 Tax=Corynascus novoguineensis TaxID=1126955 RepID=A0AAN7HG17_9PEZI|nr:chloride channel [Corynascus novoguineensis]